MNPIRQALEYSFGALVFGYGARFPLSLAVLASLAVSAWRQRSLLGRLWKPYHWFALTQLFFVVAAVAIGVLLPAADIIGPGGHHHEPNQIGERYLDVVSYSSYASCAFWIWRMKGFRWFAASMMAMLELPVLGALFVAGMSVAGDWI